MAWPLSTRNTIIALALVAVIVGGYFFFVPPSDRTIFSQNGVQIQVLSAGNGDPVESGDRVSVHYTGMLTDGTKFDSSVDRGEPISFTVGSGELIKGFDAGVAGMSVGEKRRITIPPQLAYGAAGIPNSPIGPNATLVFEVELVAVQ